MTRAIIRDWLNSSEPDSLRDEVNIAREIAQTLMLRSITEACAQSDISRGAREALLARAKKASPATLIHEVEPLLPASASLQRWDMSSFFEAIHRLDTESRIAGKGKEA